MEVSKLEADAGRMLKRIDAAATATPSKRVELAILKAARLYADAERAASEARNLMHREVAVRADPTACADAENAMNTARKARTASAYRYAARRWQLTPVC